MLLVMAMTQECPEQRPAPLSGVIARPHQGALMNNVQWVHIPVLVNLTAWSPDLDEHCKGESVTQMYKDLMTTAFLKYHNMVAADFRNDSPTPTPTGRKLLGFLDGVLGATGTGLGKAEALPGSAQSQTSGMRCCSHDGQDSPRDRSTT
ncbi:hypothetical protein SKAU_G00020820 [Synaphobranchus kaupii]|uniref:Uncharacterized protein n=1 Tax=Synaphobranchus kaupii TaxID=118154 RepID=A0A9Q1GBU8_SYNKA|nr:hypothetical protein SKAU_G00020820 [Synaphobranchus kaupii]